MWAIPVTLIVTPVMRGGGSRPSSGDPHMLKNQKIVVTCQLKMIRDNFHRDTHVAYQGGVAMYLLIINENLSTHVAFALVSV